MYCSGTGKYNIGAATFLVLIMILTYEVKSEKSLSIFINYWKAYEFQRQYGYNCYRSDWKCFGIVHGRITANTLTCTLKSRVFWLKVS